MGYNLTSHTLVSFGLWLAAFAILDPVTGTGLQYLNRDGNDVLSELWISEHALKFDPAFQYCIEVKGKLVTIENHVIDETIMSKLIELHGLLWTSGSYNPNAGNGTWVWLSTGNTIQYKNWLDNAEPSDPSGEDCIAVSAGRFNYGWKSHLCNLELRFICQVVLRPVEDLRPTVVIRNHNAKELATLSMETKENIPEALRFNNNVIGSWCVNGTWLWYETANYDGSNRRVISGVSNCSTSDSHEPVAWKSIRFVGSPENYNTPALNVYQKAWASGNETLILNDTPLLDLPFASLILSGPSPVTLYSNVSYSGLAFCIRPFQSAELYTEIYDIGEICYGPDWTIVRSVKFNQCE